MTAVASSNQGTSAFNPHVILAVIVAGALALLAYVVLTAFQPQLSSGNNGGNHALSNSATGFAALVELAKESGINADLHRDEGSPGEGALLILTPDAMTRADDVDEIVTRHSSLGPTLIILPKWITQRQPMRTGWVQRVGVMGMDRPPMLPQDNWATTIRMSQKARNGKGEWQFATGFEDGDAPIRFRLPADYQAFECSNCEEAMLLPGGEAFLIAETLDYPVYVLADPDVLNNYGLRDKARGKAALALLDQLAEYGDANHIAFDVTLNGFGAKRSILRFLFLPPFLAITLCLVLAAALAGWQAFNRFGPPARRRREIALGKSALIANGAELMKQSGKQLHGADVYARHVRERLAQGLKAPSSLEGSALDAWLDRFTPPGSPEFSRLMTQMFAARTIEDMVAIGQQLSRWRKDVLREH